MSTVASPCIGICRLSETHPYCVGCGRTVDEVAAWRSMPDDARQEVWSRLPERFAELGIVVSRLPWDEERILDHVEETLRSGRGTWVLGVYGAGAEFLRDGDEAVTVTRTGDAIEAVTARAALRLAIDGHVRALKLETGDSGLSGKERIVLAVPKGKRALPAAPGLTSLGEDRAAIREGDRGLALFDLGLGRSTVRFCVRTGNLGLAAAMQAHEGRVWPAYLPELGETLIGESPWRVVETRVGRVEVGTPIPPPGGRTPDGPHSHFLADRIALNLDMPPGLDLPDAYVPGAIFYA